jgi:hypothetical protein
MTVSTVQDDRIDLQRGIAASGQALLTDGVRHSKINLSTVKGH